MRASVRFGSLSPPFPSYVPFATLLLEDIFKQHNIRGMKKSSVRIITRKISQTQCQAKEVRHNEVSPTILFAQSLKLLGEQAVMAEQVEGSSRALITGSF